MKSLEMLFQGLTIGILGLICIVLFTIFFGLISHIIIYLKERVNINSFKNKFRV